ncbi:MAG: 30S ribosome-binding factor RbfA [Clostridia bacterium]|nr:30S ribosome-binding factor RbfA [Clostridia bacterium]MBR5751867.1 30S ribosome-binding factor RbfA [Clostridia bacterium]
MAFDRTDRISEEVRHALDRIIRESVKDPRVKGTWSITRCEVTKDLRYCKVRVSVLEDDARKELVKALKNAAGFIRRELGREVDLRYTPELIFENDLNMEYAQHIGMILAEEEKRKPADTEEK